MSSVMETDGEFELTFQTQVFLHQKLKRNLKKKTELRRTQMYQKRKQQIKVTKKYPPESACHV